MTKKTTKKALVASLLSLLLCFSMLIGTTFAWFTDSVTSANNIIKSGTLDIGLSYSNDNSEWDEVTEQTEPIFNYQYWEPGYTDVKYIKISNNGTLAFKYQLNIVPNFTPAAGDVNLADVIDVYMFDANATLDRDTIAAATPVGTLSDLIAEDDGAAHGVLLPAADKGSTNVNPNEPAETPRGEITYCVVLKMQETAGNEYQGLTIGGNEGFALQLLATQYTWENDSFDHLYDDDAVYDEGLKAKVEKIDNATLQEKLEVTLKTLNGMGSREVVLNTGYIFTAPETAEEAANNPYALWHADFVVTFDRNVTADDKVGLAGQYTYFNDGWFGAFADKEALDELAQMDVSWVNDQGEIIAGAPLRLLSDFIGVTINYQELCELVKVFKCGAWGEGEFDEPLTMTVELRLYEVPEKGNCDIGGGCDHPSIDCELGADKYITIGTYSYTFTGNGN